MRFSLTYIGCFCVVSATGKTCWSSTIPLPVPTTRSRRSWKDHPLALECVAVMLNINYGHNDKLMGSCKRLHDYAYFVQRIKDGQAAGLNLETAIRVAMDECIERDILADLLIKSRSEVYHMLLTEFDEKAYKKRLYKDGVQDGIERGIEAGRVELQSEYSRALELFRQTAEISPKPAICAEES